MLTIFGASILITGLLFLVNACVSKSFQCVDVKNTLLLMFFAYTIGPSLNVFKYLLWSMFSIQFCNLLYMLVDYSSVACHSGISVRNTNITEHLKRVPAFAYMFGSWMGSVFLVLDWNSKWQVPTHQMSFLYHVALANSKFIMRNDFINSVFDMLSGWIKVKYS